MRDERIAAEVAQGPKHRILRGVYEFSPHGVYSVDRAPVVVDFGSDLQCLLFIARLKKNPIRIPKTYGSDDTG